MDSRSALKLVFTGLLTQYAGAGRVFDSYWKEIVDAYSAPGRHYHNLDHLHYICKTLKGSPGRASNEEAVHFALFYHDLVYEIPNVSNEEQSAEIAARRMKGLGVDQASSDLCIKHILATKDHKNSDNADTNLFCDADMAVLGDSPEVYKAYCKKLRAEFSSVSPEEYARGRISELEKMLDMEPLFKTLYFRQKFEVDARRNMLHEVGELSETISSK